MSHQPLQKKICCSTNPAAQSLKRLRPLCSESCAACACESSSGSVKNSQTQAKIVSRIQASESGAFRGGLHDQFSTTKSQAHVKHFITSRLRSWFTPCPSNDKIWQIDTDNYRQMTTDHEKQWQMGIWFLSQHAPFPMDYWRMVSIIWWPWWPSFCGWISEDLGCWIWLVALPFSVWCFGSALGCASHEVRVYTIPHM